MSLFPPLAVERAMKIQEVILRAANREITWITAARIMGISARSMRRMKARYEKFGCEGLLDRRRGHPSAKRAPLSEVRRILELYRDRYTGFNPRHFRKKLLQEHGIERSYTFVKGVLQTAGLVRKYRKRGRHHRRREPKACFGEMLHIDGSRHHWLALEPEQEQILIVVLDDATSRLLYAQFWPGETTEAVMWALRAVVAEFGVPLSLYNDRARWAFYTPKAGEKVSKTVFTEVGRALDELGVEHIPAYSAQARGRSERVNRTLQDRLVNELRLAGIRDVARANAFIRERYIADHNQEFAHAPKEPTSSFIPAGNVDLDEIFCTKAERTVGNDNVVRYDNHFLQIGKQKNRATCAGLHVEVRAHLDGTFSIVRGVRLIGRYDAGGQPINREKKAKQAA